MRTSHSLRRDLLGLLVMIWLTSMIIGYCIYKKNYHKCNGYAKVYNTATGQVTVTDADGNILCIYFEQQKPKK